MQALVNERTGVLVIRVWAEGDRPLVLRARMTWTLDVTEREQVTAAVAGIDAIETATRAWLEEFMNRAGPARVAVERREDADHP